MRGSSGWVFGRSQESLPRQDRRRCWAPTELQSCLPTARPLGNAGEELKEVPGASLRAPRPSAGSSRLRRM